MKELFFAGILIYIFIVGFFAMKKIDSGLENNHCQRKPEDSDDKIFGQ